jgi:hypothetical protein
MMSTWPTLRESGLANSLASTMASTVTLYFRAMLDRISPFSTVCVTTSGVAAAEGWRVGAGTPVCVEIGVGLDDGVGELVEVADLVGVVLGDGIGELVKVAELVGVDGTAVGSGRVSVGAGVGVGVAAGVVGAGRDADAGLA